MNDMGYITFLEGVRLGLVLLSLTLLCMVGVAMFRALWMHYDNEKQERLRRKTCPHCGNVVE